MKILRANRVIDVFFGDGWENWTRFLLLPNKAIKKIAGNNLTPFQFTMFKKEVLK